MQDPNNLTKMQMCGWYQTKCHEKCELSVWSRTNYDACTIFLLKMFIWSKKKTFERETKDISAHCPNLWKMIIWSLDHRDNHFNNYKHGSSSRPITNLTNNPKKKHANYNKITWTRLKRKFKNTKKSEELKKHLWNIFNVKVITWTSTVKMNL